MPMTSHYQQTTGNSKDGIARFIVSAVKNMDGETNMTSGVGSTGSVPVEREVKKDSLKVGMTRSSLSGPVRLDDQMKYDDLRKLESIFKETCGGYGLDMDEFRFAMRKTMGYHISDSELDMIFMKIDTNCDGTVDWNEYLSYMLLEYQEKENMVIINTDLPFPNAMTEKPSNHLESICGISLQEAYTVRSAGWPELDDASSRYITLSKEGVLNVWNMEWNLQKSTLLDGIRNNPRAVWFTTMVCMPNCNTVAVASTDYEISFYSMTSNMFQKKFQIRDMECCALSMDFYFEHGNSRKCILLWGDSSGSIYVLRFYDNPSLALFSMTSTDNKMTLSNLLKTHIHNLRVAKFQSLLPEWVKELHYYVNEKKQEFIASCCRSRYKSMMFAEITEKLTGNAKKKIEMHRKSYFSLRNGVSCVSYDHEWNVIVTGSSDFYVRVWNPYSTTSPTMILKGHVMPVQLIYARASDHHVISVSKDKNVRIWSLVDYSCKQSIHGRHVPLGRLDITALYYNEHHLELVLGTNTIGVFSNNSPGQNVINRKRGDVTSHVKPITKVLYNNLFKQLITGGEDSMVSVWDMKTGTKTMQFCATPDVEITSMTFDPTYRRLITGSRNGAISIWNFNNGAQLREFKTSDEDEVSALVYAKNRIISAGWNKNVTVYQDSYADESYRRMRKKHKDDILSMDYHRLENVLGTSSYDGEIFIWSLDVESVLCKLNMHESILPILEHKQTVKSDESGRKNIASLKHEAAQQNSIYLPSYLPWVAKETNDSTENGSLESDEVGDQTFDKSSSDKAVNKIIFLQSRRSTSNIATLLSAVTGYVVAWSMQQLGGILGYFSAVKHSGETVVDMDVDESNEILITADSRGYLRVWQIRKYCNGKDVFNRRIQLAASNPLPEVANTSDGNQADAHKPHVSYAPMNSQPKLLTSFRGHCRAITSIAYIEEAGLIASGSADCSVRLWSVHGRYIGTFGQSKQWDIMTPSDESCLSSTIPTDIRRVASPTTLYTVKGGHYSHWKHVKHAVGFIGKHRNSTHEPQTEESDRKETELKTRLSKITRNLIKVAQPPKSEGSWNKRGSVTVWTEDRPHSVSTAFRSDDKIDIAWKEIQENGMKSRILGKINYKPKQRHKTSTIDPTITWVDQSAIVYSTLTCSELVNPIIPEHFLKKPSHPYSPSLSRCGNKAIERRRLLQMITGGTGQNVHRNSNKQSNMGLEGHGDGDEIGSKTSNSRPSTVSSHKTKLVSFFHG